MDIFALHLPNPLQKDRRGLFHVKSAPPLDPRGEAFRRAIFLSYFAGWRIRDDNDGSYEMKMAFPDPVPINAELDRSGWILPPDPRASLARLKVDELKAFAADRGVTVKGTKPCMIESIVDQCPAADLAAYALDHRYYEPSPLGFRVLRALYNDRVRAELRVTAAISAGLDDEAYRIAVGYWATHPAFGSRDVYPVPDYPAADRATWKGCYELAVLTLRSQVALWYIDALHAVTSVEQSWSLLGDIRR